MEIQLTLDDKEIREAITFWLESSRGITGVKNITMGSNYNGSTATVKLSETDFTAGVKKQAKKEISSGVSASTGRQLDVS